MPTTISLHDIARGTLTNAEFLGINADLKRLDERIGKLLREGHGGKCSCPACRVAGPLAVTDFVADLHAFRWLFRRRVYFGPTWLLTDAEARRMDKERVDGQPAPTPSPSYPLPSAPPPPPSPPSTPRGEPSAKRTATPATVPLTSAVPAVEIGAESKVSRRKRAG